MTIQEAIRSEKPFKRENWPEWFSYRTNDYGIRYEDGAVKDDLDFDDILADDWEVKP